MQSIIPPPIKIAISDDKSGGLVNIIWNQFFMGLYKLFAQPSYGSKICTFTISGITGEYTTDYKWISDRDFIHFYITIIPTTKIGASDAKVVVVFPSDSQFVDTPTKVSNILISLLDDNKVKDSRTTSIDENGQIIIPDIINTGFTIKINGSFIKSF